MDYLTSILKQHGLVNEIEVVSVVENNIVIKISRPVNSTFVRGVIAGALSKFFNKSITSTEVYSRKDDVIVHYSPYTISKDRELRFTSTQPS